MRTACAQHIQRGPPPPRLALAPAHCRGIFVVGNRWRIGTPRSRKCLVARTLLGGSPGRCVTPKTLKSGHRLPKLAITCREHDCQYSARRPQKVSTNHARCQLRQSLLKSGFCSVAPRTLYHWKRLDLSLLPLFFLRKWPIITVFRAIRVTGAHLGGHAGR